MAEANNNPTQQQPKTLSHLLGRSDLMSKLGMSHSGKRDVYEAAGWNKNPRFRDYYGRYKRDGIAKRIVDLPVRGVWSNPPTLHDESEDDIFKTRVKQLDEATGFFQALSTADRLSRIGSYGVLLIGAEDGNELSNELESAETINYFRAYSEHDAKVQRCETDKSSPRFGMPIAYRISIGNGQTIFVHHSRVIHIAEDSLGDPLCGTPALEACFNYLTALELIIAGCGEMFWRGGFPGIVASIDKDATVMPEQKKDMQEQLDEYIHGLRRVLRTQGTSVEALGGSVANPQQHVSVLLDLIAGTTSIPKRLLIGSERGELASTQDKANFASYIVDRRANHVEPSIVRPVTNRLIELGVLPEPNDSSYTCHWNDPHAPSENERASTAKIKAEAIRAAFGPSAETLIPLKEFFAELGWEYEEPNGIDTGDSDGDGND